MPTKIDAELALLYLSSPTLPIGSFAYSQGLEKAIENELVTDKQTLKAWCEDALRFGLARLDLRYLSHLHEAFKQADYARLNYLNAEVLASRETSELLQEEINLGGSLDRLLRLQSLSIDSAYALKKKSFLYSFAHAAIALEMRIPQMHLSFVWSWLENQTAVACKAIPLGQTDAQAVLLQSRALIKVLIDEQPSSSEPIFGSLPGQALLSAMHETQYSRLFRS
jgi:urease accessory protein